MALELYRPGVRSLAVSKPNPRARRRYRFAAHKKRLRDPSTRVYEAMLVFSQAIGQYAGTDAAPARPLKAGLNAVFQWWCAEGPRGTDVDKRATGVDVAVETAEHFGFDRGLIDYSVDELVEKWGSRRCRNGRPQRGAARPFDPQIDPVVQNRPLHVPKYRFS